MSDGDDEKERRFIERIAGPMRAPERLRDSFEARVMLAAHDAVGAGEPREPVTSLAWWRRPRTVSVSPMRAMAMAASVLVAVLLAGAGVGRLTHDQPMASPAIALERRVDTVHVVRFMLTDAQATSIVLVGDFNDWSKSATPLTRTPNGKAWIATVNLPAGRHEYAFLVRDDAGEHWVPDPFATTVHDDFGTVSSLVHVGSESQRTSSSS